MVFYVRDGGMLSNQAGYRILSQLQRGTVETAEIVETVAAGASTYDYSCWYAKEFAKACGIYDVGSTTLRQSLSQYTASKPLRLSQILREYTDCTVYWLACRESSSHDKSDVLENAPDAFPGAAPARR
ncbi:hypothetical protein A7982_13205 [Minicystis rosea]|nr:hypothetical protein A7982_13205 [Minicystis rosea]